jgi:5-methylcytosine-specific restriction endonuclease McrA
MRGKSGIGGESIERASANTPEGERLACTWCGNAVEKNDGYRLGELQNGKAGDRGAVFCRLEHVVPWAMQGAHWKAGQPSGLDTHIEGRRECAHCGDPLGDSHVLLVHHRCLSGQLHRIPDGFCSVGHLLEWAKAGGRWRS